VAQRELPSAVLVALRWLDAACRCLSTRGSIPLHRWNEVSVLTMVACLWKVLSRIYGHIIEQNEFDTRSWLTDGVAFLLAVGEGVWTFLQAWRLNLLDYTVNKTSWDEIFGLLTCAGALAFQPWIARSVRRRVSKSLFHANMWQSTFGAVTVSERLRPLYQLCVIMNCLPLTQLPDFSLFGRAKA
jgi:hypothetical protein